jgi:hypothetical protein
MSASSILSRPPKFPPAHSLGLGVVLIPVGTWIQGMPGGILLGVGIGLLIMAAWDFTRLRCVAWWRRRAERAELASERPEQ